MGDHCTGNTGLPGHHLESSVADNKMAGCCDKAREGAMPLAPLLFFFFDAPAARSLRLQILLVPKEGLKLVEHWHHWQVASLAIGKLGLQPGNYFWSLRHDRLIPRA